MQSSVTQKLREMSGLHFLRKCTVVRSKKLHRTLHGNFTENALKFLENAQTIFCGAKRIPRCRAHRSTAANTMHHQLLRLKTSPARLQALCVYEDVPSTSACTANEDKRARSERGRHECAGVSEGWMMSLTRAG